MLPGVLHRDHQALSLLTAGGRPCPWYESAGIQVDPPRQRARAHRRRRAHAQTAHAIALADQPLTLARVVIVEDARRPGPPDHTGPGAHLDPDARVRLDVPDPVSAAPALG